MDSPIHFKEDTGKPENRTNLALFSILMIPEIHSFVCDRLGLPDNVIIFPSPNLVTEEFGSTLRPDFKITKSYPVQGADVIGYIEVELARDDAQIERYRKELNVAVYSIVGKKSCCENAVCATLSLEEIYRVASDVKESCLNTQKHASLDLFCTLAKHYVIDGNFNASNKRSDISEEIYRSPLIQKVYSYFGETTILRKSRIKRRKITLDTVGEKGFSLGVYCTKSANRTFKLMNRTAGRNEIEFPSLSRLKKWFPLGEKDTEFFAETIAKLGAREIYELPVGSRAKLPIKIVEDNSEKICDAIKRFL